MSTSISGASGPFKRNTTGYYGKNAAHNVQAASADNPEQLLQATIRYTPSKNPRFSEDAFGYAQQDIQPLDQNQDGKLSRKELTEAFAGIKTLANRYLKALDTNNDQQVDAKEMAAYVLFQDDSANLVQKTIQAMADEKLLSPELEQKVAESFQSNDGKGLKSKADGQLTPYERAFAETAVMNFPAITKTILSEIAKAL